jgi:hypothetical protein
MSDNNQESQEVFVESEVIVDGLGITHFLLSDPDVVESLL